jgi:predicted RNA-binding protein with TRAM domain
VLAEGKLADLAPAAPFAEGDELQVELVEVDRHDGGAAIGKLEGFEICVADAAALVGKRVKVRIERILDGTAYATMTRQTKKTPEPLTAEAEAEKPTRKPPARKDADTAEVEAELEEDEAEVGVAEEGESAEEGAAAPKKKTTRRGSRGGKNRRKTAKPAGEGAEAPEAEVAAAEPEPAAQPDAAEKRVTIHLPADDLGDEAPPSENGDAAAPAKKKTRRGSRGGKNRRKRAAAAANGSETPEDAVEEPSANGSPEPEWGYVPMSEWADDFRE